MDFMATDSGSNFPRRPDQERGQKQARLVNKSIFTHTLACPTLGWSEKSGALEKFLPLPTIQDEYVNPT